MDNRRIRKNKLPDNILSKRNLPLKPDPIELYGKYIKLLPLDIRRDSYELFMVSNGSEIQRPNKYIEAYSHDEKIWKLTMQNPFETLNDFTNYLQYQKDLVDSRLFCIFDAVYNYQIGIVAYRFNAPEHLRIEIGSIFLSPIAQSTKAATEALYLLLKHAFALGYRRILWSALIHNVRSYRFGSKAGFSFEFTQKNFFVLKGRVWDAAVLKILDFEWPEIKKKLEELLYSD